MSDLLIIGNYFGIAISAIFFIIFYFTENKLNKARSFVMIGMLLFAFSFLFDALIIAGENNLAKIYALFYFPILFALYPLIFHYIINLNSFSEKMIIEKEKFILPIVVFIIILFMYYFIGEKGINNFIFKDYTISFSNLTILDSFLLLIIILYYLQASYYIYRFLKFQVTTNTKLKNPLYLQRWVRYITFGVVVFELAYILFPLENKSIDIIISILLTVFLGVIGIKHNEIILNMKITNGFKQYNIEDLPKRKRESKLSTGKLQSIIIQMDRLISVEKLYLDPNLKLKNFAKKIHIPEKELSILINDQFNKNFTTYINSFRIDEAKNILEKRNGNFKLENLYLEVGFFTRSTFNRVFKSTTNTTPTEYKKSISLKI